MRSFNANHIPPPQPLPELSQIATGEPLDIEIGAGQGLHAVRYCQTYPHRTLVAIERTHTRFAQLVQRQKNHPTLSNLIILHADAQSIFVHAIDDESVERIFLLYPNPYPKAKQANLRWHNMPFTSVLKRKLKANGQLILATNIQSYAQEAEDKMLSEWGFKLVAKEQVSPQANPRTHFEKKYLERGEICWNLVFVNTINTTTINRCD